jgi:hypothetical protein
MVHPINAYLFIFVPDIFFGLLGKGKKNNRILGWQDGRKERRK